jgi:hypothetical protein
MGKWGIAGVLVAMIASAAFASSAMAGQIVYVHGGDLWAMNDNGTDQHVLVTARQVGGSIGQPDLGQGYTGLSVQPNGTAVVFDANVAIPRVHGRLQHCAGSRSVHTDRRGGEATVGPAQHLW